MKTAIYIEDGVVQLVITPESDFEKNALASFNPKDDGRIDAQIFSGSFYDCRGGWTRQTKHYQTHSYGQHDNNDKSLILRAEPLVTLSPDP